MFTMVAEKARKAAGTVAAIAIVSGAGLVLDQAHLAAAPRGTVEVGELAPADTTIAMLPEVTVVGKRVPVYAYAGVQLPEVVVVAKRAAQMVAKDEHRRPLAPSINAGF
jgi:hypothetical protein